MTGSEALKLEIISQITLLNDAKTLAKVAKVLKNKPANKEKILKKLAKPTKNKLDIEQLKKEQKFTAFNRTRFDELIKELDIQESIEQLIQSI